MNGHRNPTRHGLNESFMAEMSQNPEKRHFAKVRGCDRKTLAEELRAASAPIRRTRRGGDVDARGREIAAPARARGKTRVRTSRVPVAHPRPPSRRGCARARRGEEEVAS